MNEMFPLILAQLFAGLTATYDGGTIYFTTSLRLKGESFTGRQSRLYAYNAGTFRLIYAHPNESVQHVAISEDGRALVAHLTPANTLLIRDGNVENLNGQGFLSRNGRFLLMRDAGGISMIDLETGQHSILTGETVVSAPTIADDGRLTAGTPVCGETYLNPSASHAVDICPRTIFSAFRVRFTCDAWLRDIDAGTSWKFAEDDCSARAPMLSNEWLALPRETISLREQKRYPISSPALRAITPDETSLLQLDDLAGLSRKDIRTGTTSTLMPPVPFLSAESAFLVPGSLISLTGYNLNGAGFEFATSTHRFPAQSQYGLVYGVAPRDLPLGDTELRLISPSDSPFEQVPTRVSVLDWQPWPANYPGLPFQIPKPGEVMTVYLTGLREGRGLNVTFHVPFLGISLPLGQVRYFPAPGIPGVFSVEVRLPPAAQWPPPFPGTNTRTFELEIGPAGPRGPARLGYTVPIL